MAPSDRANARIRALGGFVALTALLTAILAALFGPHDTWVDTGAFVLGAVAGGGAAIAMRPPRTPRRRIPHPPASLDDARWLGLVEELMDLVDELDEVREGADRGQRVLAAHLIARLAEILERCDVDVIAGDSTFDRARHSSLGRGGARARAGTRITGTASPGFAVGPRVLRRARVRLAKGEM